MSTEPANLERDFSGYVNDGSTWFHSFMIGGRELAALGFDLIVWLLCVNYMWNLEKCFITSSDLPWTEILQPRVNSFQDSGPQHSQSRWLKHSGESIMVSIAPPLGFNSSCSRLTLFFVTPLFYSHFFILGPIGIHAIPHIFSEHKCTMCCDPIKHGLSLFLCWAKKAKTVMIFQHNERHSISMCLFPNQLCMILLSGSIVTFDKGRAFHDILFLPCYAYRDVCPWCTLAVDSCHPKWVLGNNILPLHGPITTKWYMIHHWGLCDIPGNTSQFYRLV